MALDDASVPSKTMSSWRDWRRWLHCVGSALALAGVAFVAVRLHTYWGTLDKARLDAHTALLALVLALIYGAANIWLALAWREILAHLGALVAAAWSVKVYGLSQLARYLPGNIFHLAGRQALGMAAGLKGSVLAKSAVWELVLIAVSGSLFAVLAVPGLLHAKLAGWEFCLWATVVMVSALTLEKFVGKSIKRAFLLQTLFLALSGLIFVLVLKSIIAQELRMSVWPTVVGAYVVAWLVGLAIPGAPAGVGIREMVLLFLLGKSIPTDGLIPAVVLSRITTVLGDALFFGFAAISGNTGVFAFRSVTTPITNNKQNRP